MSTRDELNQANNRNGDLLTEISKLQKRIAELEAALTATERERDAWERNCRAIGWAEANAHLYRGSTK